MKAQLKLRERDKITLERIKHYILKDITVHHTIPALSRQFGLNEFKLKNGFKYMFGSTIYKALEDARMHLALELLETTNMPIYKISEKCGYRFHTNFASRFKRRFGHNPDTIRPKENTGELIQKVKQIIENSISEHHTAQSISLQTGVAPAKLVALFKQEYGMDIYRYLRYQRLEHAKQLIIEGNRMAAIAKQIGYKNVSCVYIAFKQCYHITIGEWKRSISIPDPINKHANSSVIYDFILP